MVDAETIALAAQMFTADAVEADHVSNPEPVIDVRKHLHGKQREAYDCDSRVRNILGGRQGGKSYWLAGWLWAGAFDRPGSLNCYIALSKESARWIIWPEIVLWSQLLGIDPSCLSESTLTARIPMADGSVSVIRCSGTDDRRTIESWRGIKVYRLAIDEMGSQPEELIKYFIGLLWPTMAKHNGQMARAGTPGVICAGYWHDQTGDQRKPTAPPLFTWTIYDNPGITELHDVEAFIDEMCADLEIDRESVTYLREILAKWATETDALVFPVSEKNWAEELPTHTEHGQLLDTSAWRFVLSEDVGYVDALALTLVGAHPDRSDEYVVSSEKHAGWLSGQAAERMRAILRNEGDLVPAALAPALARAVKVIDTGGAGKGHAEELRARFSIGFIPAEKQHKESAIRVTRDRVKNGRTKILTWDKCDPLREEWAKIGWDPEQKAKGLLLPRKGKDHCSDSTCYGLRYLRHYRDAEEELPPAPGTPEYYAARVAEDRAKAIERAKRRAEGRWR